jgi:hypothetical protein
MKESRKLVIILGLLLLLSILGDIYFLRGKKKWETERNLAVLQYDSLLAAKLQINKQFDMALEDIKLCKGRNTELDALIDSLTVVFEAKRNDLNIKKETHQTP